MNLYLRSSATATMHAVVYSNLRRINVSWWPTLDLLHEDVKTHVQMQS